MAVGAGLATFETIVKNLTAQLPGLWKFMTAATYLTGIWFAFRSLYHFKEYGELRMMMSTNTDLRRPLTSLMIAVMLLWWPTLMHGMLQSTFGSATIMPYSVTGSKYDEIIKLCGGLIQFIGFIAFVRGWILLSHIGQQGAQPGQFGKAMAHIFAGLFAINIFGTWKVLETLLQTTGNS